MKRIAVVSVVACFLALSAPPAWCLAGGYPADRPVAAQPDWPKGLVELANSRGRIGGYFVNANDYFTYSGNADALNAFLVKFAAVEGAPRTIVLREGTGKAEPDWARGEQEPVEADWQLSVLRRGYSMDAPNLPNVPLDKPGYVLIVDVWLGGKVERAKLKLPAGVEVRYGAKLKLTIRCTVDEIRAGDEIPIEFTITNEGKDPYIYQDRDYDRSGRMNEYRLYAADADGETVPDPCASRTTSIGGGLSRGGKVAPGESYTKVIALNRWALVTNPGRYTVAATYRLEGFSLDRGSTIISMPIAITVVPRTFEEMGAYIDGLARKLRTQTKPQDRHATLRKLIYTCDARTVPVLIDAMYAPNGGLWESEGLLYYLGEDAEVLPQIKTAAMKRGLTGGMLTVLVGSGFSAEEMFPLIERSLSPDCRDGWQEGALAAQMFCDDRFVPLLIFIAEDPKTRARETAMHALVSNRTDEGVAALRRLLDDPDGKVRAMAADAVRSGYRNRGNGLEHPLREDDFPPGLQKPERLPTDIK